MVLLRKVHDSQCSIKFNSFENQSLRLFSIIFIKVRLLLVRQSNIFRIINILNSRISKDIRNFRFLAPSSNVFIGNILFFMMFFQISYISGIFSLYTKNSPKTSILRSRVYLLNKFPNCLIVIWEELGNILEICSPTWSKK